ncbi:MAG: bifunctional adenosylcobinamide kinase/adenosylcobinamide-phosphate guanylyltransferase [Eubacterium sp.]|nr:bifunctional adenosylcobinamide kinase/adenosylcobinamide-phosphate guanylyltransferase [Eubacterium sp.]
MILVIGGAFQGKYTFASEELGIREGWADGDHCRFHEIYNCRAIHHFHDYVKRALEDQYDLSELVPKLLERNPDICILTNEMGYGVVPTDEFERELRDRLGSICTELAAHADVVYRMICGIPTIIKGNPEQA